MSEVYAIVIEGLSQLKEIGELDRKTVTAAYRAINTAADRARAAAKKKMLEQVNFPASYVGPSGGRFVIGSKASSSRLEGSVSAQVRPTSLARFGAKPGPSGKGATVEVTPGRAVYLKQAFFVKLRSGSTDSASGNRGLAIRLPPGRRPRNSKIGAKQIGRGLWLLYGPSVYQAFVSSTASGQDVATQVSPFTLDVLQAEFLRLMGLDNGN